MTEKRLLTPYEIVEYALRIDQEGSLLNESLLLEKLDGEAALKISQGNDRLIEMLDELNQAFAGKAPAVDDEIEKLRKSAEKSAELLEKLVKGAGSKIGSEKLMAKIASFFKGDDDPKATMNAVLLLQSRAQELVEILKYSLPKIIEKLEDAGAKKNDERKIHEVLGIDPNTAKDALLELLGKARPGLFKSVGNFFKSLKVNKKILDVNEKVDYDAIAEDFSVMKASDAFAINDGTAGIKSDGGDDLKDVMKDAATDLKDDEEKEGEEGSEGEAGEGEGGEGEGGEGEGEEGEGGDEKGKKEAEVKADPTEEITAAAKEEVPPKAAVTDALSNWYNSLTASSQKRLSTKRLKALRTGIFGGIDDSTSEVAKAVEEAIAQWRAENEEFLTKTSAFAKKNFETLEKLVPDLVKEIMGKANESNKVLTREDVKKVVYYILSKRAARASGIISEASSKRDPGSTLRNMVQIAKILKEMRESDVRDSRGNVVIEPGLKVRHKKSGLEYSVQDVEDSKGKVKIVLAVPEMPRVDATKTFPSVVTEKDEAQHLDNIIDAAEAHQETIFVVDEKEFDKDYEVK